MFHTFSASANEPMDEGGEASKLQDASPTSSSNAVRAAARSRPTAPSRESSGAQVQQTLTVCSRCRKRKIRCDPGLPRCVPCEKAHGQCEYFDATKQKMVSRKYVVWLQHKIQELEVELARLEAEDKEMDTELAVRNPGLVRLKESEEMKFLGPSSGIAISRVVMNLAKQFSDSQSIKDIISETRKDSIEARFAKEEAQAVPEQPPIPMYSEAPAVALPSKSTTSDLVQLFFLKAHAMYPILHEPSFLADVERVYNGSQDPFQNFAVRMVIAVGLQRMEKHYAGLADAYYLAALKFLEDVVRMKNLHTLQAYALIAVFSLLTPTRTAIYYVIGSAVRLAQALGFTDERTIGNDPDGALVDSLELDMRRRVAWSVIVMDLGLAHSLGRPSAMAVGPGDVRIQWFAIVDDEYITREGILSAPTRSIKKWIAMHFFKMRLLQLEIRKGLYLKKRAEPTDDSHPWFVQMEKKLQDWRDASPREDGQTGMDKIWFTGRYNTMVVFLNRPSPQIPRPSTSAALKCYAASRYNVQMHREQIQRRNVETTWVFTQSIFMAINTLLWTLSYEEVRRVHPRDEVQSLLDIGLESILLASERWPGAASAHGLYLHLIDAVLKIYEKDGDIQITVPSSTDSPQPPHPQRSQPDPTAMQEDGVSPLARPTVPTIPGEENIDPLEPNPSSLAVPSAAPFGYIQSEDFNFGTPPIEPPRGVPATPPTASRIAVTAPTPTSMQGNAAVNSQTPSNQEDPLRPYKPILPPTPASSFFSKPSSSRTASQSPGAPDHLHYFHPQQQPSPPPSQQMLYDSSSSFNQLPTTFAELANWSPNFVLPSFGPHFFSQTSYPATAGAEPSLMPSNLPFDAQVTYTGDLESPLAGAQQPMQQYQDVYPDSYWTPAETMMQGIGAGFASGAANMPGNGLPVEHQADLMQSLETAGPPEITRMIEESQAFFDGRWPA